MGVRQLFLDVGNCLAGVEVLRAGLGAVHDGVAAVELEAVVERLEPLLGELIPGVLDPPVRLKKTGRITHAHIKHKSTGNKYRADEGDALHGGRKGRNGWWESQL